jgi:phosphoglycolate phosphatase-like HAD superfamily hydrolase
MCTYLSLRSSPAGSATIRAILARHDLDPGTVLFVGDAAAGWRAAREIGLRFIGRLADAKLSPIPAGAPVISDLTQLVI